MSGISNQDENAVEPEGGAKSAYPGRHEIVFDPLTGMPCSIDPDRPAPIEYAHPTAILAQDDLQTHLRPYKSFKSDRPWLRDPTRVDFTPECKDRFLEHYARTGCFADAAAIGGTSESNAWWHINHDIIFAHNFQEAKNAYRDLVLSEVRRRGINGVVKAKWHDGKIVGHEIVHSDRLLELEAKRIEPSYREGGTTVNVNTGGAASGGNPASEENAKRLKALNVAELKQLQALAAKVIRATNPPLDAPAGLPAPTSVAQPIEVIHD